MVFHTIIYIRNREFSNTGSSQCKLHLILVTRGELSLYPRNFDPQISLRLLRFRVFEPSK